MQLVPTAGYPPEKVVRKSSRLVARNCPGIAPELPRNGQQVNVSNLTRHMGRKR